MSVTKHLYNCDVPELERLAETTRSLIVYNCALRNCDQNGRCRKCGLGFGIATGDLGTKVTVVTVEDTNSPNLPAVPLLIACDESLSKAVQNVTPVLKPDGKNPWDQTDDDNVTPFKRRGPTLNA